METTAIVILAAAWFVTMVCWALLLQGAGRRPPVMIFTAAMTVISIVLTLNAFGYVEIFDVLTPPPAETAPAA